MNPKRKQYKTLEEFASSIKTDGVMVRVACFRIDSEAGSRLEVQLEAAAEHATIDVPLSQLPRLDQVADQAARAFAASLRLRIRPDGRLR
jgi:hypothetical protein